MAVALATAGTLSYTGALWTNTSSSPIPTTTTALLSCLPCSYLQIEPGYATWTPDPLIKPLATTQVIVDPNSNTTSTSIKCDTAVLSSYSSRIDLSYTVDESCNLVARYVGVYGGSGNTKDFQWATVTLTEPTGIHIQMGGNFAAHGEIFTTDTNGKPTCISSWQTYYDTPAGVYTDALTTGVTATWTIPVTSTATIDGSGITTTAASYSTAYGGFWLMPELSKYLPGLAAVSQCKYIIPGGSPMALQPANSVKLPTSTLPRANSGTTTTSAGQQKSSIAEARPGPVATSANAAPPAITNDRPTLPTQHATASAAKGVLDTVASVEPPKSYLALSGSLRPVASAAADSLPDPVETTSALNALGSLIVAAAIFGTNTEQPEINAGAIVAVAATTETYIVDQSTIYAGGAAVTVGNTVCSALPAGSGILVAANGLTSTIHFEPGANTLTAQGISFTKIAGSVSSFAYGSTTISAGGPALTTSGTVFSALPSGSGLRVVANGRYTTIPASALPTADASSAGAYSVHDETVLPGSPATTNSGTINSALPSSNELIAATDDHTTTPNDPKTTLSPKINAITPIAASYILDSTAAIRLSGSAVAINGTEYSALPSDEGVLIVAAEYTTTIMVSGPTTTAVSTTTVFVENSASAVYVTETRRPPSLVSGGRRSSFSSGWEWWGVMVLVLAVLSLV